jgi:hypothetical protein
MRALRVALSALLIGATSTPSLAAHWVEIGSGGPHADTLYVDIDSLRTVDNFRVLDIMTRYATPRPNANDVTFDRYVQTTAFDCKNRAFALVRTVGYLGEQRFGSDQDVAGWQDKMSALPDDKLADRIFGIACPSAAPVAH